MKNARPEKTYTIGRPLIRVCNTNVMSMSNYTVEFFQKSFILQVIDSRVCRILMSTRLYASLCICM